MRLLRRFYIPLLIFGIIVVGLVLLAGAGEDREAVFENPVLSGQIEIDGSSTVGPITLAVAEEFGHLHPNLQIPMGVSGTGGGFKRFTTGDIAISNASRPIKQQEADSAQEHGIHYVEIPVAYDGLSIVVNPRNRFVQCLTTDELQLIWEPDSAIKYWSDVRPTWPDSEIHLYGPGTDSGTFDYFTEVINGESGASRPDYTASEDDNVLVKGVSGDRNALGYFGYAFYSENSEIVQLVEIDSGDGCTSPSDESINDGTYSPLAREIFIYVNTEDLGRIEVEQFIDYYLTEGPDLVTEVGYVPLRQDKYEQILEELAARSDSSRSMPHRLQAREVAS